MSFLNEMIIEDEETKLPIFNPILRKLKPFQNLIKTFRSKGIQYSKANDEATTALAYIYYMCYYNSPYVVSYPDDKLRQTHVKDSLGLPADWKENKEVKEAKVFFDEYFQSNIHISMINAARLATHTAIDYFKSFKPNPNIGLAQLLKDIGEIPKTLKGLDDLEDMIKKDISAKAKIRSGGTIASFEEPTKFVRTGGNNPYANLKL